MLRFERLGSSVPDQRCRKKRGRAGKAGAQARGDDAAVGGPGRSVPSERAKKSEKAKRPGESRLNQRGVVAAAHRVPLAEEGRMRRQGGKQA